MSIRPGRNLRVLLDEVVAAADVTPGVTLALPAVRQRAEARPRWIVNRGTAGCPANHRIHPCAKVLVSWRGTERGLNDLRLVGQRHEARALKDANADIWHRLDVARLQLKMRACYCSVFDECWETDLERTSAKRVGSCPAAKVPFTLPTYWFESAPAAESGAH